MEQTHFLSAYDCLKEKETLTWDGNVVVVFRNSQSLWPCDSSDWWWGLHRIWIKNVEGKNWRERFGRDTVKLRDWEREVEGHNTTYRSLIKYVDHYFPLAYFFLFYPSFVAFLIVSLRNNNSCISSIYWTSLWCYWNLLDLILRQMLMLFFYMSNMQDSPNWLKNLKIFSRKMKVIHYSPVKNSLGLFGWFFFFFFI